MMFPPESASPFPAAMQPIHIQEVQVHRGPNAYSLQRVVRIRFKETSLNPMLQEALEQVTTLLPELPELKIRVQEQPASRQLSTLVQLLVKVLQDHALKCAEPELRPSPGKVRDCDVLYGYGEERIGLLSGWLALQLIEARLPECCKGITGLEHLQPEPWKLHDAPVDGFWKAVHWLQKCAQKVKLGPTTEALVDEARRRGLPVLRLDEHSLVQIGHGRHQQRIRASITSLTSGLAIETACDKDLTKTLLFKAGIPAPEGRVVRSPEQALEAAHELGFPLVTKPLDGNHGRGVTLDLESAEQILWGFEQARLHSEEVIIEQQFKGRDYRVLVVGGKVVAVAERVPAHVVGNGISTIEQLVQQVNLDPRRGEGHEKVLTRLSIDDQVVHHLARAGWAPVSVPPAGEVVFLRDTANLSTGGTAIDRTDEIHPENRRMFERAARTIGLDVAGLDVIAPDLAKPIRKTGGGIIEVNACPGFRMHLEPSEGQPRNVAAPVLDLLFPPGQNHHLPVAAITGTNGKTTTSKMLGHILKQHGHTVGLTTSTGIYVDGHLVEEGDTTGPRSARTILMDPEVDFAVLETARGGLLREGLAFEQCDAAAVLNIQEDHLGLKGIETLEDLAWIKSLVLETVRPAGHCVLNADDPMVLQMQAQARGQVILFSMEGRSLPALQDHLKRGGTAVVHEHLPFAGPQTASQSQQDSPWLVVYQGDHPIPIMPAREIPATLMGLARVNIENALAAIGLAHASGVPAETIRAALCTFGCSFKESPGRLNFHRDLPFTVLMDYAHNPAGIRHLMDLVQALKSQHGRVIGVVGAAGDRRDQDIRKMGELCAGKLDQMVVRDDDDTRGRQPGVCARLLREGALAGGMDATNIHTLLNEQEAVKWALEHAEPGDLVVVVATEVEEVWDTITSHQGTFSHQEALQQEAVPGQV